MDRNTTPLLVSPDGEVSKLLPLEFKSGSHNYDELWLQKLIHNHPSVLPIAAIEPAFWPATAVCMELPLRSGYLDNLLVTPSGDLIVVACKLWRNMEARRKVVAQIIDYAKDLQGSSYLDLEQAVRSARKEPGYELYAAVATNAGPEIIDESAFVDVLSRNLRRGRMLLLIVGDGVTENVTAMAEFLHQHAGLHFALALVQLSIHELPTKQWVILPSIPARTTNVVRGIVEYADSGPKIVAPPEAPRHSLPSTLTSEDFLPALDRDHSGTSDRLIRFLDNCSDLQISWEVKKTLIVRMIVGEFKILPLVVNPNGRIDTSYNFGMKDLMNEFAIKLASAIPGAITRETPKTWTVKKKDGDMFTVLEMLENTEGVRASLERVARSRKK